LICDLIFSRFSRERTILCKKVSNLPLASPAFIKLTTTVSNTFGCFSKHLESAFPASKSVRMLVILGVKVQWKD